MEKNNGFWRNEEGVSEAIGFILLFTIVLTGIGMVSLYGYPILIQSQINSDERVMEQSAISLQNDMKLLTMSNVPYRDTALMVSGGVLHVFNQTDSENQGEFLNIHYYNNTLVNWDDKTFYSGELRYTSDQGTAVISLENGAVVKRQIGITGSAMIAEPRWFYDTPTGTLVIFLTAIDSDRPMALAGVGDIQMSMLDDPVVIDQIYGGPLQVDISFTADPKNDYKTAWNNYLGGTSIAEGGLTETAPGVYSINVNRLIIKEFTVRIESV